MTMTLTEKDEEVLRRTKNYKALIFVLTFFSYASFHMSRKPPSIVKSVLHPTSPKGNSIWNNVTNPGWRPFNEDLLPKDVSKTGYDVDFAGIAVANGDFYCTNKTTDGICTKYSLGSGAFFLRHATSTETKGMLCLF